MAWTMPIGPFETRSGLASRRLSISLTSGRSSRWTLTTPCSNTHTETRDTMRRLLGSFVSPIVAA